MPTPVDHDAPEHQIDWYSIDQAAEKCGRSRKRLENLISRYQLPRRLGWKVRNRVRRRVVYLSPAVVAWLQRVTTFGEDPRRLQRPKW